MADEVALLIADVYQLAGEFRRSGEAIAAAEGQTQARWQLLSVLGGGDVTVARAARRLGVTRQAVQRIANELVGDGLAAFEANPDHRSSPLVRLNAAGSGVLAAIDARASRANRRLAERMGRTALAKARADVHRLLAKLEQ